MVIEVSGKRLWSLFKDKFGTADAFFADHFVANYCPLAFLEESGRNLTPDKLPIQLRKELYQHCKTHLETIVSILQPERVIGIGRFAFQRASEATDPLGIETIEVLHPSPASPAANKDWKGKATRKLVESGVW